uniref:Uncharacterized protein n=1 Tax=Magallana gigas TaxID=29159 RepID=K1P7P9_MAGGI
MLTEQELSKLDMADGELKTPLSTTPTEDFNPLVEDPDNFISGHSPQRQGHHDADCSGSEEESDYQCNSMEEMSTGNLYGVTPPTYMRGVKRDKKKHQTNIQKSSYKQFTEQLKKASKKSHRNADCPCWFGQVVKVDPTAETAIALSHTQAVVLPQTIELCHLPVEWSCMVPAHTDLVGNER